MSEANSTEIFAPGSLVGSQLRVEAQLGSGGMAVVHRVLDLRSGRALALKQMRVSREGSRKLVASQFEREYHTLCQLAHPRIIEVYDYGVERGSPYYTMELLDGEDLLTRGQLPWRTACALLCDVASSLAMVHSRRLVHRDLSPRNVRCTSDGHAKLIDFGAMAVMGASKNIVGTPSFIAPETLQLQALDGRADLYSLGALAYWALTGYHAYHARRLSELPDLWRCSPLSPRFYEPDLPVALDELVMELLKLDPAARPARAAEVIERLSGVAGLPMPELPEESRAYLVMPQLVGRESQLQQVRRKLDSVESRTGATFLIQGAAGMGRSRTLQACILQAKLLGALVLRSDAEDASTGDYGVARALLDQLFSALPELREQTEASQRALLENWMRARDAETHGPAPARRPLQAALRTVLSWAARRRPLVIAVDDFDLVDEPSAALIATLAAAAPEAQLFLLLSCAQTRSPPAALGLIEQVAEPLALTPLDANQTEALLRSVFGDVNHVAALAERVHRISAGNPRAAMALCEHLVERKVARYEAGSWSLPNSLNPQDLPESLSQALQSRLSSLPADARELAEALSLSDAALISLRDYAQLTTYTDPGRLYRALDALVMADVLVTDGDRYRFRQEELCQLLRSAIDAEKAVQLHARLAQVLASRGDCLELAQHLLGSKQETPAIELLLRMMAAGKMKFTKRALSVLETAVNAAERLNAPLLTRLRLSDMLVLTAAMQGHAALLMRHAQPMIERLVRDSGLADLESIAPGDDATRAREAVQRAQERYDRTPQAERGWTPHQAAVGLSRMSLAWVTMAIIAQDLRMLEPLPSLAPLIPVSEESLIAHRHRLGASYMLGGHAHLVHPFYVEQLEVYARYKGIGINAYEIDLARASALFTLGIYTAGAGHLRTREYLAELQQDPRLRVHAWRVRMIYELMLGNSQAAHACQRRAELLQVQDGDQLMFPGTTIRTELVVYTLADDILGVKRAMTGIEELASYYPGWRPVYATARATYLKLKGDFHAALEALRPALEQTAEAVHAEWGNCHGMQVELLTKLGRFEEAIACGRAALARAPAPTSPGRGSILLPLSRALIAREEFSEAQHLIEEAIQGVRAVGTRGLRLCIAYEARARLGIAMRDEAALAEYARLCALEYGSSPTQRDLMLNARYERLMREAEEAGMHGPPSHLLEPKAVPRSLRRPAPREQPASPR